MSLVPMASLGRKFDIRVRGMESVIRLACIIRQRDYWATGRTVERLGIADLSAGELRAMSLRKQPHTSGEREAGRQQVAVG